MRSATCRRVQLSRPSPLRQSASAARRHTARSTRAAARLALVHRHGIPPPVDPLAPSLLDPCAEIARQHRVERPRATARSGPARRRRGDGERHAVAPDDAAQVARWRSPDRRRRSRTRRRFSAASATSAVDLGRRGRDDEPGAIRSDGTNRRVHDFDVACAASGARPRVAGEMSGATMRTRAPAASSC